MRAPSSTATPGDAAMEVANVSAALGVLTIPLFPFALPALAFIAIPLLPLVVVGLLVGLVIALLAGILGLPVLLVRRALARGRTRRTAPTVAQPGRI
jgi:hypothetical protein